MASLRSRLRLPVRRLWAQVSLIHRDLDKTNDTSGEAFTRSTEKQRRLFVILPTKRRKASTTNNVYELSSTATLSTHNILLLGSLKTYTLLFDYICSPQRTLPSVRLHLLYRNEQYFCKRFTTSDYLIRQTRAYHLHHTSSTRIRNYDSITCDSKSTPSAHKHIPRAISHLRFYIVPADAVNTVSSYPLQLFAYSSRLLTQTS